MDPLEVATRYFGERGEPAWLVGGRVRDALLGRAGLDTDIVVLHGAIEHGRAIARRFSGAFVLLDRRRGYARVVWADHPDAVLDITDAQRGDLGADLAARDYTVNALAVPLGTPLPPPPGAVIDPLGGLADLAAGQLRPSAPEALDADPLRLWRGPRLATTRGLALTADTRRAIADRADLAGIPAAERIREELLRLLAAPRPGQGVAMLAELGLLASALPELLPERSAPTGDGGAERSLDRSSGALPAATVAALDGLAAWQRASTAVAEAAATATAAAVATGAVAGGPDVPSDALARAAGEAGGPDAVDMPRVLVDFAAEIVGMPPTAAQMPHARDTWQRLALLVAASTALPGDRPDRRRVRAAATGIAVRLRLPTSEARRLATAARLAAWLGPLGTRGVSRRTAYRFFNLGGEGGVDAVLIALALDHARDGADTEDQAVGRERAARALLEAWFRRRAEVVDPPPLVDGIGLMAALGLTPGPLIGRLLAAVREAQAVGEVTTADDALALAERLARGAVG